MLRTNRKELLTSVTKLEQLTRRGRHIPALGCVRIENGPDGIELQATDLETSARWYVETDSQKSFGPILVPAAMLRDVLKTGADETALEIRDGDLVVNGTAQLRLLPVEDFPKLFADGGDLTFHVDSTDFVDVVTRVAPFASRDDARPVLTGVKMDAVASGLRLVATDSYRMAIGERPSSTVATEWGQIVPAHALKRAAKWIGKRGKGGVAISRRGESGARISYGVWDLDVRQIEGEYPQWQMLVPDETKETRRLTYRPESMTTALAGAASYCHDRPIVISCNGSVELTASSPDLGRFESTLDAEYDGEYVSIGLNPSYLRSAIDATDAGPIEIREALKPAVLRGANVIALVMPVRTSSTS